MRCLLLVAKHSDGMRNHWHHTLHDRKLTGCADVTGVGPSNRMKSVRREKGGVIRRKESSCVFLKSGFDSRLEQSELSLSYSHLSAYLLLALFLQIESRQDLMVSVRQSCQLLIDQFRS